MKNQQAKRRQILKLSTALAGAGILSPFAFNLATMTNAVAAGVSGYRGIVFLNFSGGNDGHNTVLATDAASWQTYQQYRDTTAVDGVNSINLSLSSLLPIRPTNTYGNGANSARTFALHPNLPNVQRLFAAKRAAIVANVGPLIAPLTASQYSAGSVPIPLNLFSHNSQSATWQAFDGSNNKYGWGGRLGDLLLSSNSGASFTCISASGSQLFLQGSQTVGLEVGFDGLPALSGLIQNNALAPSIYPSSGEGSDTTVAALNKILTQPRTNDYFASDLIGITNASLAAQKIMAANLVATVPAPPSDNALATQLAAVLRVMASSSGLGVTRQVFFVQMGGFDTHDGEVLRHQSLLQEFDDAVAYFDSSTQSLGLGNNAVLFTGSEFGRSFTSNGDGTDHGWGNHHFVIGGDVKGGDIYGAFPTLGVNNANFVGTALLPSIAVDEYASTLATWLGVPSSSLADVFPNIGNFATTDLGFMSS